MKSKLKISNTTNNNIFVLSAICTTTFILSEYCKFFHPIDQLHFKHFILLFFLTIYGLFLLKGNREIRFMFEIGNIILCSSLLLFISLFFQIKNNAFKFYALEEIYYLIAPILFVWIIFNLLQLNQIVKLINLIFIACVFSFITRFAGEFALSSLKKISFVHSNSPFESDLAQFFLLLYIFFKYTKQKLKSYICAFLTILCFKRVTVIVLILLIFGLHFIPHNKRVNKILLYCVVTGFIVAPFFVYLICTDSFANWFYQQFQISLNYFTMTRIFIINTVIDANLVNYGLGTVTNFLEARGAAGQLNMHNDILRIYMECTIIGSILFSFLYFHIAKNNYFSFIVMLYAFLELFVAHYIGPGSTSFWVLSYILIFFFNSCEYNTTLINSINRRKILYKRIKFRFV